jgi:hypothetical protein
MSVFNMLFLVSTRLSKFLRGEPMDEELFRGYFVKLYRKMVQIETHFLNLLDDDDKPTFMLYSRSLREVANTFKVAKDPTLNLNAGVVESNRTGKRLNKHQKLTSKEPVESQACKLIFGLGNLPTHEMKYVEILPLGFEGFYKAIMKER